MSRQISSEVFYSFNAYFVCIMNLFHIDKQKIIVKEVLDIAGTFEWQLVAEN